MIDLQCHTTASDGEDSAQELIDKAIKLKLTAITITDHDSLDAVKEGLEYVKDKGLELVTGIELSCDDPLFDLDKIDMLGLFVDPYNDELNQIVQHINEKRNENKRTIIGKLKDLGYEISYDDVKATVKGTFRRPHIAKYLLKKYPEKFSSVGDVFDQLIGTGKPAFHKMSQVASGVLWNLHTKEGVALDKITTMVIHSLPFTNRIVELKNFINTLMQTSKNFYPQYQCKLLKAVKSKGLDSLLKPEFLSCPQ